jgi:hypothetical protein
MLFGVVLQACPAYGTLVVYKGLTVPQNAGDTSMAQVYHLTYP